MAMGCIGEMVDGANREWLALGIWRLVCSGVTAWPGQEGLEHVYLLASLPQLE